MCGGQNRNSVYRVRDSAGVVDVITGGADETFQCVCISCQRVLMSPVHTLCTRPCKRRAHATGLLTARPSPRYVGCYVDAAVRTMNSGNTADGNEAGAFGSLGQMATPHMCGEFFEPAVFSLLFAWKSMCCV